MGDKRPIQIHDQAYLSYDETGGTGNTLTVTRAMDHLSHDDTAGCTPAQNHRDKQKSIR